MDPVFDLDLYVRRLERAIGKAQDGADFLLRHAANEMAERLAMVERQFKSPVQLEGYTSLTADLMQATGKTTAFSFVSTLPIPNIGERKLFRTRPEMIGLPDGSADLIAAPLSLQTVNDTPGILIQARRALVPDGLFLASALGAGTLGELRQSLIEAESGLSGGAYARVHPFADVRDYGALLQRAGFALPVADLEDITVRYDDIFGLMRDLRAMGMTNVLCDRSRTPPHRRLFERAGEIYAERFSDSDGRIRARFSIIHLSGWVPHESQQKPLKPGSAKARLADALKTSEGKLPG